jgi:outer membrane protein assembly factor BamB
MKRFFLFTLIAAMCLLTVRVWAGDWPQFRYDASRTAASPLELPEPLQLRWMRKLPSPRPAFPHELRLAYDASYEPVVSGGTMFVPSMVDDSVTALDTATGEPRWQFFAEGPVRFAPVAWEGKIYFVSDDGYLYCLDANDGTLRWRFRGLPEGRADRKVLGHGRLVSLWPARGGPVLADGVVYFAAGLWPTEGVFVHAVDAESGTAVWSNTDSDRIPRSNWDHGVGFYSGLTPQGYLAVVGDWLVVPCGSQLPAFLDLKTGELHTYTMGWGGRNGLPKGGWFVAGLGDYLSHSGDLYDITRPSDERFADTKPDASDYKPMLYPGGWTRLDIERANQRELDSFRQPVFTPEVMYESDRSIVARDLTQVTLRKRTGDTIAPHREQDTYPDTVEGDFRQLWELSSRLDVHIKAGSRLYVGGPGVVEALDVTGEQPEVVWRAEFEGTPQRMLAAGQQLFVVTTEGDILAFGAPQPGEPTVHEPRADSPAPADHWTDKATAILQASDVRDGYALVLGINRGRLVEELVRQSDLHVIAVDEDAAKVAALRQRLDGAGLYATRAAALVGDPLTYPLPPYLASLVVTETPDAWDETHEQPLAEAVFHALRPYGGVACAWGSMADRSRIEQIAGRDAFPGAAVRQVGELVLFSRTGALPGAADWSHAEANAASTGASEDDFIRSPMAVLWFDASQRWHKYPGQVQVRVAGGRIILSEEGVLRATDVYTGRKLWETSMDIGLKPLDDASDRQAVRYQRHRQWGPSPSLEPTTQLVAVDDTIYVSQGTVCQVLDPSTGERIRSIPLPEGLDAPWANLRVTGNYLVGTSGPHVLCMDRRTGDLRWRFQASRTSLSLAVSDHRVFCAEVADQRRGESESRDGTLMALDIATGERLWQRGGGARLRYSRSLDLVITPVGFYRGSDGTAVWQVDDQAPSPRVVQGGGLPAAGVPGWVAGDRLLTGTDQLLTVYELPSGNPVGEPLEWVRRGCTGTRASTHLVTTRYRSNSAWIDLHSNEITPFFGLRPGCQVNNNLYPANGVMNMPNLTAGCTCNFVPASVACVPAQTVRRTPLNAQP